MQTAEVVLNVLRERGRKGLPCEQLYRQLFNKDLYYLFVDRTTGATRRGGGCAGRALTGRNHATLPEEDAWHYRMRSSETWRGGGGGGGAGSWRRRGLCGGRGKWRRARWGSRPGG